MDDNFSTDTNGLIYEKEKKKRISSIKKLIHSQEKKTMITQTINSLFVDFSWQIKPLKSLD